MRIGWKFVEHHVPHSLDGVPMEKVEALSIQQKCSFAMEELVPRLCNFASFGVLRDLTKFEASIPFGELSHEISQTNEIEVLTYIDHAM